MIIPDNVTVYMNGRAYCAHVCSFYQNGERLSLSIDTNCFKGNGAGADRMEPPHKRREITISAKSNGKSVTIAYDPSEAEAVKAAEAWRKALFDAARWEHEEPVVVRPRDTVKFGPHKKTNADKAGSPDALMEAVKGGNLYLRKVKNPETGKTYFRMGFEQSGFDRLSPVVYLGNDKFHDCAGDFDGCAKSDYWELAPIDTSNAETRGGVCKAVTTKPKNGNCIYASDKVRYALDAIAYLSGNVKGQYTYIPLTAKQREAIDTLYEDLHSREPLDAANLFKPGSYEPKDLPPEHEKASKPQDERRVTCDRKKPAETVKWGHWEKSSVPCEKYVCSECGGAFCGDNGTQPRYCHNCGARMENATTFAIKPAAGTAKHEPATPERIADTGDFDTLKALVENALTALNRAATEVSRKSEYDKGFHSGVLFAQSLLKESDEDLARWHRECQTRKGETE